MAQQGRRGRGSVEAQQARQQAIWEFVTQTGSRSVSEIAKHAAVSQMTVYRDLADMEEAGQLRLQRGTVTAGPTHLVEASSRYRVLQNEGVKERLAEAALTLVEPGQAIMMDDSSTGLPLGRLLAAKAPLTVVTNYVPLCDVLAQEKGIRLVSTGGEYLRWADAWMGTQAVAAIAQLRADLCFMSSSAIVDGVCYHPTPEPAEVKRAMLAASAVKVLYADHTKFARTALHRVAGLSDFDVVIVDDESPAEALAGLGPDTRVIRLPKGRSRAEQGQAPA